MGSNASLWSATASSPTFPRLTADVEVDVVIVGGVHGIVSPWTELYAATRVKPISSAVTYVGENVDFPMHLVSDRLHPPEAKSPGDIRPGQGKTIRVRGERLAAHRDPQARSMRCRACARTLVVS